MNCRANGLGLATLRLIGEIFRPANMAFHSLAGSCFHDELLDSRDRLAIAEHERHVAWLRELAFVVGNSETDAHHVALNRLGLDRCPCGALVTQAIDLVLNLLVGDGHRLAANLESVGTGQIDGGPHFVMKLEG